MEGVSVYTKEVIPPFHCSPTKLPNIPIDLLFSFCAQKICADSVFLSRLNKCKIVTEKWAKGTFLCLTV